VLKKAPNAPTLQAAIDNAGGEVQRAGASGSMSSIRAMRGEKFVPGSVQGVLPVKGDIIETLWTEDDKDDEWFAVEVLLGDVGQLQARKEKRERFMKCHLIQYPDNSREWAPLLSWPDRDRPTRVQKAGGSQSAKNKAKQCFKQEAALEVVQWRSPALSPVVQYLPLRRALTNNVRIRCTWRGQAHLAMPDAPGEFPGAPGDSQVHLASAYLKQGAPAIPRVHLLTAGAPR
jgi:hypothetical protein